MKRWTLCLISCLLMIWAVAAPAAEEDPALKDLRAKWEGVRKDFKDMTMQYEMTFAQSDKVQPGPMQMTVMVKGEKGRTEMEMTVQGMTLITIFDGKDSWMIGPMGVRKMPGPNNQQSSEPGLARAWPDDARLTGNETVSGRECSVIEFKDPKLGGVTRLWVDPKATAIVKSESKNGARTVVSLYSDFRKVLGDYEMGFKCEILRDDKPVGTMIFKSVKVNTGLADDLFDPQSDAAKVPAATKP